VSKSNGSPRQSGRSAHPSTGLREAEEGPKSWANKRLKFLGDVRSGIAKGKALGEKEAVTLPYLRVANVQDGYIDLQEVSEIEVVASEVPRYLLRKNDVLMNEGGDNDKLGRGAVWKGQIDPCIHQNHVFAVRLTNPELADWVSRFTSTDAARTYFYLRSKQSTNLASINQSDVRELPVPMPPDDERAAIVNFLDEQTARIDSLIAQKEALAASLKDIEEVTAYDLVTRGLKPTVSRASYREEWLRDAPAHWKLQKLRQLATVGNGSTPKRDNEDYWVGGQIPWLNSAAVNAARITEASDFVTAAAKQECHLPLVRAGSTVVALTGQGKTRGTAAITEIETTVNQHLAFVSLFDARMTDEYLWVLLTGMYSVLRYLSDGVGSTKGALTCEQLNQLRVLVPPTDEQEKIVSAYRERIIAIEVLREHTASHIDRLREYRSSLISAAVTGQLDLRTFKEAA